MFSYRWRPFRLFGIPIGVDLSWLLILALITWTMAEVFRSLPPPLDQIYPNRNLGLSGPGYWLTGLIAALAFFLCVVLHEMGHAFTARAFGMRIRGITLFLFGGVAELDGEPPSAGAEFAVALAGPLVSLILSIACGILAGVGFQAGWPPVIVIVLTYLASINLMVLLFNMVPAFPLDGGRVLRSILWAITGHLRQSTWWASLLGQVFAWVLMFLGLVQIFHGNMYGIWLGLIGMFLNMAARGSYDQVLLKQYLEGEPVRRFMTDHPVLVPPELDLTHLVEDYVFRMHRKAFPVGHGDHLEGYVSTEMLTRWPRNEWDRHSVGEVMQRDLHSLAISPDTDALEALRRIQSTGSGRLLVVQGDRLLGVVSLKDLMRFLQLKLELQGDDGDKFTTNKAHDITQTKEKPLIREQKDYVAPST